MTLQTKRDWKQGKTLTKQKNTEKPEKPKNGENPKHPEENHKQTLCLSRYMAPLKMCLILKTS